MQTALRVLCYGDSNTWGRSGSSIDRYPANVRWTKLLQEKLGDQSEVIEEGLRSRTTDLDDDDPQFPNRNGHEYLRPCLESQSPLDIVILWLGTNDFKAKFNRTAEEVATALEKLVEMVKTVSYTEHKTPPRIILVSPPLVRESVLKPHSQFRGAEEKSRQFAVFVHKIANKHDCSFIDLAQHVHAGDADGVHLDPEMHPVVAELLYQEVLTLPK